MAPSGFVPSAGCSTCNRTSFISARSLTSRRPLTSYALARPLKGARWQANIQSDMDTNIRNINNQPGDASEGGVRRVCGGSSFSGIISALTILTGTIFGSTPSALAYNSTLDTKSNEPQGTSKELRYDGRTELGATEKMLSLALTGGAFAMLSAWAYKRNRLDDEEEQIRIKEEVERLEKLKAEFLDVEEDDESIDDEDLYKELSKRLGETDIEGDDGTENENNNDNSNSDITDESNQVVAAAATAGDPSGAPSGGQNKGGQDEGDEKSLDMLRRMWDASDQDPKGDTNEPKAST